MLKSDLLGQLETLKNNFALGLAALSLFADEKSLYSLRQSFATFGEYRINFSDSAALLSSKVDRDGACKEFLLGHFRSLLKEAFEVIKYYVVSTGQAEILRQHPSYLVWRMVRNALSHDMRWRFHARDLQMLPICWKGRVINPGMHGQPVAIDTFGYGGMYELYEEMTDCVHQLLA